MTTDSPPVATRIFVAGAAGAIGRQLVPLLITRGHAVVGTTRDRERAEWLRSAGAEPVILDVFDADAVRRAVSESRPDVVIHQLTDLAVGFEPAQLQATARLRQVGTRNLVEAMLDAGAGRLVAQSGAWLYGAGTTPHTEDQALGTPGSRDDPALAGILELERLTLQTPGIDGLVLRYGFLYGPGTVNRERHDIRDGPTVQVVDAAWAAALAAERGAPGPYNVVDDAGGVSNRRARDGLGWEPGHLRSVLR